MELVRLTAIVVGLVVLLPLALFALTAIGLVGVIVAASVLPLVFAIALVRYGREARERHGEDERPR